MKMKFFRIMITAVCLIAIYLSQTQSLHACTGIKLIANDGSFVQGRTVEFGIDIDFTIVVVPRDYEFVGMTPRGPGLSYKAKYASLGIIAFNNLAILDGINEKGLAVGTFYFPGFADYVETTPENRSKSLSPSDFANWILTQFATVEEVKDALSNIVIAPTVLKDWGGVAPPFHYIVYDRTGKNLVIEPLNGQLVTDDDRLGVFTNSPTFDWQITNLRNFINLTPFNVKPIDLRGLRLAPFGQGSGMVGMPGDFTPPSRFVRAAIFSATATPSNNGNEAVFQAFHILNQFDIPVGVARAKENGVIHTDYTQLTCVRNPQDLKYYFKTYKDQTIRMVDLKKFDFHARAIRSLDISGSQSVSEISSDLK